MEWVYGVFVFDIQFMLVVGVSLEYLFEFGVEIFFIQVFWDNFFYVDMYFGNVMVFLKDLQNL